MRWVRERHIKRVETPRDRRVIFLKIFLRFHYDIYCNQWRGHNIYTRGGHCDSYRDKPSL